MIIEFVVDVLIQGGGVAACCAAHLLQRAGRRVAWQASERPRLPAILLSESAQTFISGIFGRKDLFDGCDRITRRVVAWGGQETVTHPHSAILISEHQLLDRLRPQMENESASAQWTIFASRPPASTEHKFGTRSACAAPVEPRDASVCAIESLNAGWLFLASRWLLAVGGTPENLLAESRVIPGLVSSVGAPMGEFTAYPRIASPLAGPGWLACGSGAMAFDPICGDGTGNAIREAILASAVVGSALRGDEADPLLTHYESRLKLGFKRHLLLCRDFYRCPGSWWDRERLAIEEGIAWCGADPRFEYQLVDFDLRRIA